MPLRRQRVIVGTATATTGTVIGVEGGSAGTGGYGVYGNVSSSTGATVGVKGNSTSTAGTGVRGTNTATTGATTGVSGYVASAAGIAGAFNNAAGGKILSGQNNGVEKFAVDGSGNITRGKHHGRRDMTGTQALPTGVGLTGDATNTTGANTGVMGETASTTALALPAMRIPRPARTLESTDKRTAMQVGAFTAKPTQPAGRLLA